MTDSKELKEKSKAFAEKTVKEYKEKLKYTKKSAKRKRLERDLMFWETQLLEEREEALNKFFGRYPHWDPK